jgi:ketosteroid isomerase-like protein
MSPADLETARRAYAAFARAFGSGNIDDFRPLLEEFWDPEIVLMPAGVLPDSRIARGGDAVLRVVAEQMQAFEKGSTWLEPLEFIDAGDRLVVTYRFGGRGRHTEIEVEFSFAHLVTIHETKAVRVDVYETKQQALEAVGLSKQET